MTFLLQIKSVIVKHSNQVYYSFIRRQQNLITQRGMKAYIQIIGQNSPEGPPSIILNYDTQRYLFNCREGTQRLCIQEKARLGRLSNVFLTRVDWECMGGLTGMLLTLTDAGVRNIDVHGGKNLAHFIAATRHFVYRTNATVNVHEFDQSSTYTDQNLTITPVIILPNQSRKRSFDQLSGSIEGYDGKSSSEESDVDMVSENRVEKFKNNTTASELEAQAYRMKVISRMFTDTNKGEKAPGHTIEADCTPRPTDQQQKTVHPLSSELTAKEAPPAIADQRDYLMKSLPKTKPYPAAITYICQGAPIPGKFNKKAAIELGIKPGPVYGSLQKGIPVTLEDGRVITKDMVCDPERPGYVFMIVDCPHVGYIDNLVNSNKFDDFKKGSSHKVNVMVHYANLEVLQDSRYKEWLDSFDSSTDHIFGSTEICAQTVQYTSHAIGQVKLSKLNDKIFPIPKYSNVPKFPLKEIKGLPKNSHVLQNMTQYVLEPNPKIEHVNRLEFDHTNIDLPEIKEIHENKEYQDAVKLAKQEASKVNLDQGFPGDNVEIITLGTGSSIPAKYRNVSATLVKIPNYGSIMLDAGEGTYGQMIRKFGIDKVDEEVRKIRCLFISHLHADHHLGVVQLINKWNKITGSDNSCLTVIGPFVFKHWLTEYSGVEYLGTNKRLQFIRNENILENRVTKGNDLKNLIRLKNSLGLCDIKPVEVVHCRWAYGLSIKHESGWKLVYSGDTRPCDKLVEAGENATLLIHEATLEDSEIKKAIAKRHSTTAEAIDVGKRMKARFTLLNHFSQRYPKVPVLSEEQTNVCFSFDLMSIPIKEIPLLPKYTEAIQLFFNDEEDSNI